MSSAVEAARRLGAPVVGCAACGSVAHLDDAVLVMAANEKVLPSGAQGRHLCSIRCSVEYARLHDAEVRSRGVLFANDHLPMRAFRWSRVREGWVEMGVRVAPGSAWDWNDTGEARWIEENAMRLREAGEIS